MSVVVTGAAGFIGYHVAKRLLKEGIRVVGIDNINSYYSPSLKEDRIVHLNEYARLKERDFEFIKQDLTNKDIVNHIIGNESPHTVIHLAAQAGVRYSLENPSAYIESNIIGFQNIIDACRAFGVNHLLFASSSSVYGGNKRLPFKESDCVEHPLSLYAATKKSNELVAHVYSHLYNLKTTGLRFFTAYGPWGRPDMALFLFTKAMLEGDAITLFNNGDMVRDFTYIDDIVESIFRLSLDSEQTKYGQKAKINPGTSWAPYRIFNVGNSNPVPLINYVRALEGNLGVKAKINYLPMQAGDVKESTADATELERLIQFKPDTSIEDGVGNFVKWYREYYQV